LRQLDVLFEIFDGYVVATYLQNFKMIVEQGAFEARARAELSSTKISAGWCPWRL